MKEVLTGEAEAFVCCGEERRVSCVYTRRMKYVANLPLFCDNLQ